MGFHSPSAPSPSELRAVVVVVADGAKPPGARALQFDDERAAKAGVVVETEVDAEESLGDAKSSLGDAKSSLGDAKAAGAGTSPKSAPRAADQVRPTLYRIASFARLNLD